MDVIKDTALTAPAGKTLYFKDIVDCSGENNSLETVNADSIFGKEITGFTSLTTGATATFNGDVTVGTVSSQSAIIYCDNIETIAGNQIYNGPVTIKKSTTLETPVSGLVTFVSTVTGDAGTEALTIDTADSRFDGLVSNLASLTTDATATFNANVETGTLSTQIANINCSEITTSGNQTYNEAVQILYAQCFFWQYFICLCCQYKWK